ncbi:DUF4199 domain-containing protein [Chitinophagaceae bacterium MMS25-I14]
MKETANTHFTYGAATALAMIVLNLALYLTGNAFQSWAQWVGYIPFIIGIILNGQAFSKAKDNYVTFGQVFGSCFKACAIITLILLVWSFASLAIFPDIIDKALDVTRTKMAAKGMSEEQIDNAIQMTQKYFKPFMVAGVLFGTMFFGAIFSLIGAAVAKKKTGMPPAMPEL